MLDDWAAAVVVRKRRLPKAARASATLQPHDFASWDQQPVDAALARAGGLTIHPRDPLLAWSAADAVALGILPMLQFATAYTHCAIVPLERDLTDRLPSSRIWLPPNSSQMLRMALSRSYTAANRRGHAKEGASRATPAAAYRTTCHLPVRRTLCGCHLFPRARQSMYNR